MSRTLSRAALAVVAVALLSGMTLVSSKDARFTSKAGKFAVTLPIGWVRDDRGPFMAVTRDGFNLHRIVVRRAEFKEAFAGVLKKEKDEGKPARRVSVETTPEELADLYIAEVRAANENAEVVENAPAEVDGHPAARLVFVFANQRGLRLRVEALVFVNESGLFECAYVAPVLHLAARDQAVFDELVKTFDYLEPKKKG